jgi:ferredoxin-NADP reductase
MYRLTLYYLIALVVIAAVVLRSVDIVLAAIIAVIVSYVANHLLAKFFRVNANVESVYITALILTLIVPTRLPLNLAFIIGAAVVAMLAKYLLVVEKRHIFNPAAISVVAISLLSPEHAATWWVGTPIMLPFVLVGGLLLIRKIQREQLVTYFLATYFLVIAAGLFINGGSLAAILTLWQKSVLYSPVFFFAFAMLTEPLTSPANSRQRDYYGIVTALFFATPQLRLISIGLAPEMALSLGNLFSYIINPNYRLELFLKWKKQLSKDTYLFGFKKQKDFAFIPGQYMEWTLPHKNTDSRGNRRYFSIASSPTEEDLMMAVKFYDKPSSYKKELLEVESNKKIVANQVSGDFILPKDLKTPLAFIAGGVGIAPFRSMIQYIIDKKLSVDIILLYTNRNEQDILFSDIFKKAEKNGVKTIYNLTDIQNVPADWSGSTGYITREKIQTPKLQKQNLLSFRPATNGAKF